MELVGTISKTDFERFEEDKMRVWNFMEVFTKALTAQLQEDQKRWGDTWRRYIRQGQEARIFAELNTYWDQYNNADIPIPWLKVAGLAMIAWIRETQDGWAIDDR